MSEEKFMRADQFMHEMGGVSRTLGRNHNARIVFRGNQAGARHNEIVYPAMPGDQWLSQRTVQVFRGFADHEDTLVGTYDKPLSPLYVVWAKGFSMISLGSSPSQTKSQIAILPLGFRILCISLYATSLLGVRLNTAFEMA